MKTKLKRNTSPRKLCPELFIMAVPKFKIYKSNFFLNCKGEFLFIINSMKISKVTLVVGIIALALASHGCQPGSVPCPSGTCHFPTYIEGCHIYQSSESCYECEYSTNISIQITSKVETFASTLLLLIQATAADLISTLQENVGNAQLDSLFKMESVRTSRSLDAFRNQRMETA